MRCPHKVSFRMTQFEFTRYSTMIGRVQGCKGWTSLVLKSLEELAANFKGPWSLGLEHPDGPPGRRDYQKLSKDAEALLQEVLEPNAEPIPPQKSLGNRSRTRSTTGNVVGGIGNKKKAGKKVATHRKKR